MFYASLSLLQFLNHASLPTKGGEYLDSSSPMGRCCSDRCYNAPHAWQLGWLTPQTLDERSLKPGQARTITFFSQTRSKASSLLINATWAPKTVPLFISYRWAYFFVGVHGASNAWACLMWSSCIVLLAVVGRGANSYACLAASASLSHPTGHHPFTSGILMSH